LFNFDSSFLFYLVLNPEYDHVDAWDTHHAAVSLVLPNSLMQDNAESEDYVSGTSGYTINEDDPHVLIRSLLPLNTKRSDKNSSPLLSAGRVASIASSEACSHCSAYSKSTM